MTPENKAFIESIEGQEIFNTLHDRSNKRILLLKKQLAELQQECEPPCPKGRGFHLH